MTWIIAKADPSLDSHPIIRHQKYCELTFFKICWWKIVRYFVVANSIACGLGALTLAIALANKGGGRAFSASRLMIILVDLLMVALLFSGIGAAGAVGLIGFKGNSHLRWNKVCHIYGTFCHKVMASLGVSILGGIAFLILLFLTLLKLSKN